MLNLFQEVLVIKKIIFFVISLTSFFSSSVLLANPLEEASAKYADCLIQQVEPQIKMNKDENDILNDEVILLKPLLKSALSLQLTMQGTGRMAKVDIEAEFIRLSNSPDFNNSEGYATRQALETRPSTLKVVRYTCS